MSAARLVVCTRLKPFIMGLTCVIAICLLASAIRPRPPVIRADVRQIREPRSGEAANTFDAQGPDGPFLRDLGPVFERIGTHAASQTIPLCIEPRGPLDQRQRFRTGFEEGARVIVVVTPSDGWLGVGAVRIFPLFSPNAWLPEAGWTQVYIP